MDSILELKGKFQQDQKEIYGSIKNIRELIKAATTSYISTVESTEPVKLEWQSALTNWEKRYQNPEKTPDRSRDTRIKRKMRASREEYDIHLNLIAKKREKVVVLLDFLTQIGKCLLLDKEIQVDMPGIIKEMIQTPDELKPNLKGGLKTLLSLEIILSDDLANWERVDKEGLELADTYNQIRNRSEKLEAELLPLNDDFFIKTAEIVLKTVEISTLDREIEKARKRLDSKITLQSDKSPGKTLDKKLKLALLEIDEMTSATIGWMNGIQEQLISRENKITRCQLLKRDIEDSKRQEKEQHPDYKGGRLNGSIGDKMDLVKIYQGNFEKDHLQPILKDLKLIQIDREKTLEDQQKWSKIKVSDHPIE